MTEWKRLGSPYGNYEVSCAGEIRRGGRELKGNIDRYGYRTVLLSYAGLAKRRKVHRLVCTAFHGPAPEGLECAHLDGNSLNNSADNLAWATRSENIRHQIAHGTLKNNVKRGEAHHASKLTYKQVSGLRARHAAGESGRKLAKEVGMTSASMSSLLRGDTWNENPEAMRPDDGRADKEKGAGQ